MIHIYHAARAYWPLLAGLQHLGYIKDKDPRKQLPGCWKWQINPLYTIGRDETGNLVCCLVHGRHGGLYRRAIDGITAIFGMQVHCVDVDQLLFTYYGQNIISWFNALLAQYMPRQFGKQYRKTIEEFVKQERYL
jgi:hypothetical protein